MGKICRIIFLSSLFLGCCFILRPGFSQAAAYRLLPENLVYQGAFAFPTGDEWTYGGHALAYYPDGDPSGPDDGYPGSLYTATHTWHDLVGEITIPQPVISRDFNALPKATILQSPADITGGWKDNCTFTQDCIYRDLDGLAYLPNVHKMAWNLRDWYNVTAYDQDSLGWSDLDMTNPQGVWHIGPRNNAEFHNARTCNYLFKAPEDFARQYLNGKWLIAGNHREGGALGGSQGPTLFALAPWEDGSPPASGQDLDAVALLYYPEIYDCVWTDPNVCYFPGYRAKDNWTGGAWVERDGKSAILIFGRKGLGESCYGTQEECSGDPCDMYKGYHAYPYEPQVLFYDQEEFKAVVAGTKNPWEVLPYEVYRPASRVFDADCGQFGAVAYDQERGFIYATEQTAGPSDETIVHVWKVDAGEPTPSFIHVNKNDASCGGQYPCYTSIQEAVDAADTESVIRIAQGTYDESVILNESKALTLQGGWDASFTTQTSNTTTIKAPKAAKGSITLQNLIVKP
jgi:hypothetical protein